MIYLIVLVALVLLLGLTPNVNPRIRAGITALIVIAAVLLGFFLLGIDVVHELRTR